MFTLGAHHTTVTTFRTDIIRTMGLKIMAIIQNKGLHCATIITARLVCSLNHIISHRVKNQHVK